MGLFLMRGRRRKGGGVRASNMGEVGRGRMRRWGGSRYIETRGSEMASIPWVDRRGLCGLINCPSSLHCAHTRGHTHHNATVSFRVAAHGLRVQTWAFSPVLL